MPKKEDCTRYLPTINFLCNKLGVDFNKVDFKDNSKEYVSATIVCLEEPINFSITLDCYEGFPEVSLEIKDINSPIVHYFSIHNKNETFSERWIDKCLAELNSKKNKLEYYVNKYGFKIGSDYGVSPHGSNSFVRDLRGLLSQNPKIIYVLKIMHIREDDYYRAFSYGIFDFKNNEWIIYPYCGSLDSGGGWISEGIIKKEIEAVKECYNVKIIELNEDLDLFCRFFNVNLDKIDFNFNDLEFISSFKHEGEKIAHHINLKEYFDAIRLMRILIDSMCKELIKKEKLEYDYTKNDKLQSIFNFLCSKTILSTIYIKYLELFLLIANQAQHNLTKQFWYFFEEVENKNEFLLSSLYVGKILVNYLDRKLNPTKNKGIIK